MRPSCSFAYSRGHHQLALYLMSPPSQLVASAKKIPRLMRRNPRMIDSGLGGFERHLHVGATASSPINRHKVVSRFNPTRNASSTSTPMQVGNGNFAFGADVTGLQTFLPYGTLSSWGWHNSSLPHGASPSDFTGLDWWTHGRLVNYEMPNPAQPEISQWLIKNPHRINLGRIGFVFMSDGGNITEDDLSDKFQKLDIYHGILNSNFTLNGRKTTVWTCVDPSSDTVSVRLHSELLAQGQLAVFFDYPYATDVSKYEAPFVGDWDAVSNHTTDLRRIILSQYLVAVNGAGNDPPQESGLVNNGWYGKFHLEIFAGVDTTPVLTKWNDILTQSADFMASFAFWNSSTGVYDLGPPMYPVSENTAPNSTRNPTFELAYWHFGLDTAIRWKERQGAWQSVPRSWKQVLKNLAPLPTVEVNTPTGEKALTYTLYEGIPNMWTDPETVTDHPALTGIYGLLPPLAVVDRTIAKSTAAQVAHTWNFTDCWGWDFPMLAMNAARLGDVNAAAGYLVHGNFQFDDVGMPIGPMRNVPTPYFPSSAGLLLAVGMLSGGWENASDTMLGRTTPGFPIEWNVLAEGFMTMF
ncbi:hypothetical protein P170DRAFT_453588 [Aspergillus steynii IBT 23096]|uniref:Uncharacterized protein n=1 Tax=Aspergillus steynii IBT 23096 TaxID=1392250 RepID=A0A2I2GGQ6_9EURO|nr:uncharacterized protein P170DRAFT_453588 [Aspergillus steynii IBT 23096]PLB52062.1 hypothetical protein P170DRAFT_453588 [Aspergillus steynii IBT 23096]